MARLIPYITFPGTCMEAMTFYKECLGAELNVMKVGDSPAAAQLPKEAHDKVMHAHLTVGGLNLMASDSFGPTEDLSAEAISLMLYCDSEAEIRSFFGKLSEGGTVGSDIKVEFWGSMYGDLIDKFGVRWMLNFDVPK